MKSPINNYKNIDKRTHCIFNEDSTFKVFHLNNLTSLNELLKYRLNTNFIQLYFCSNGKCKVAFNFEHCAVSLETNSSSLVYFKDEIMDVFFNLSPKSELLAVHISIEYFHSLFSIEGNSLYNFNSFNTGKPIIDTKEITPTIQLILNQLTTKQINETLRPVYIKGKVYELLSYYFSTSSEKDNEICPYVTNEETISKIKHAKEVIIKEMNNPPSLPELAKRVGLNIKKLKTDFKEFYGAPVFTFLLNYKMELAKKLLLKQHLNVNEIASNLGYSASSHFIAAFKKKYGITPKQFSKS
ncbi:helix-turn-helix transcriptional regulator [Lutibacter sp.]